MKLPEDFVTLSRDELNRRFIPSRLETLTDFDIELILEIVLPLIQERLVLERSRLAAESERGMPWGQILSAAFGAAFEEDES